MCSLEGVPHLQCLYGSNRVKQINMRMSQVQKCTITSLLVVKVRNKRGERNECPTVVNWLLECFGVSLEMTQSHKGCLHFLFMEESLICEPNESQYIITWLI